MKTPDKLLVLAALLSLFADACDGDAGIAGVDVGQPGDYKIAADKGKPPRDLRGPDRPKAKKDQGAPKKDQAGQKKDHGSPPLDLAGLKKDKAPPPQDSAPPPPDKASPTPDMACPDPGVKLGGGVRVWPTNLAVGGKATVTYPASGKLGGGANLTLHYGFNYWSLDLGGGAKNKTQAMTKLPGGGFSASIPLPPGGKLLDAVFYSTAGGSKTWDNNNAADWHRSIADPLLGPYLTLRDNTASPYAADRDPAHSVTVNFRSDRKCLGRVRYGIKASALNKTSGETGLGRSDHHLNIMSPLLSPDTRYYYQVTCIDPTESCQRQTVSGMRSFRTPPKNLAAFKMAVLADPQDNGLAGDKWAQVAGALIKAPHADARLVLIAGDLAGDDKPERWWTFFHHGRELFATRPLLPVVGNHDTPTYGSHADTTSFEKLFSLGSSSGKDTYWALRYGTAAFIGLNSETAQSWISTSDWKPGGKQYTWLQGALAKLPAAATWRFAAWHIPPYNAGVRHANQNQSTRGVTNLLTGKIDWVFGGHEHMYQRTKPVRYGGINSSGVWGKVAPKYGRGAADGVGYLMAPAAGHFPPEASLLKASTPERGLLAYPGAAQINGDKITTWVGFVMAEVKGKTLTLKAYQLGVGTPRDQLSYTKP